MSKDLDVLPHYFAAADIFAFASPSETFGVVLAQALASGKPVVATRTFAVRDVIEQGKSGLLVEPENPQAIARAIRKLMMDRELAGRIGEYGRMKAETTYNWDVIVRQYEAVFYGLLGEEQSI